MEKPVRNLLILTTVYTLIIGFFISLHLGVIPTQIIEQKTVSFEETPIDVIHEEEVVSYSELSNPQQKRFRDSINGLSIKQTDKLDSYTVVKLDGSYYTSNVNKESSPLFLLSLAIILGSFVLTVSVISESAEIGMLAFFISILLIIPFVFVGTGGYISEEPINVSDPNNVLNVIEMDKESESMIYSKIKGGKEISKKNAKYTSISSLKANLYIKNTYTYISSDGEFYHIVKDLGLGFRNIFQSILITILTIFGLGNIAFIYYEQF